MTSLTIASSIARADAYYRRQFAMRRRMLADSGLPTSNEANALFLFDPEFARSNPSAVERWVDMVSSAAYDPAITAARIDMIVSHDALDDLPRITCPTQIIVGSRDCCAPPYFSRELAGAIPGARLTVLDGGHFVFLEQPDLFYRTVTDFSTP